MNTNIESAVAGFIDMAKDNVFDAIQFAKANAPELVNQILAWGFYESLWYAIIYSIFISLIIWMSVIATKKDMWKESPNPFSVVTKIGWVVSVIFFIPALGSQILDMIKIKVAPMLYLTEYFASFVK